MLWQTGPLTPLGGLTGLLGDPPAAADATVVSAACWLGSQAVPKEVEGVLAVATASQLVLIQVTLRSDMPVLIPVCMCYASAMLQPNLNKFAIRLVCKSR